MDFKVGQKLKCIKSHSNGLVVEGRNYTLFGMMYLCKHYPLVFMVNNDEPIEIISTTQCPDCKKDSGALWICSSRFSPPEKAEETKTEYKVVEIDKSLKEKRKEVIHFN